MVKQRMKKLENSKKREIDLYIVQLIKLQLKNDIQK